MKIPGFTFKKGKKVSVSIKPENSRIENPELMAYVLQATNDGLWDWDLITNDAYFSPQYYTMLGYEPEEFPANFNNWKKLIHPDDLEVCILELEKKINQAGYFAVEFRMLGKNGKWKWIQGRGRVVEYDKNGNPARMVGTHTDISERKNAELLQSVQYNIATAVVTSTTVEQLVETTRQELGRLLDVTNFFVALYHKETDTLRKVVFIDEKDHFTEWRAEDSLSGIVARTGKPLLLDRESGLELARQNHMKVPGTVMECWLGVPLTFDREVIGTMVVQSYKDPQAYDHNSLHLLQIIANELSVFMVKKQAEEEIRVLNQQLENRVMERTAQLTALNLELESFAHTIAHDLRTPLRAIDGFTRILIDDYLHCFDEEGQRLCAVIRQSAGKMHRMVDGLLNYVKIAQRETNKTTLEMGTLVQSILKDEADNIKGKLTCTIGDLPEAYCDPVLIRQVWEHLLSNAVKFSSQQPTPSIEVHGFKEGSLTKFLVKDNGVGFDSENAPGLFGVFRRFHSDTEFEGLGIGLATVRRIIEKHGGEVGALSKPTIGTTLWFSIPSDNSNSKKA